MSETPTDDVLGALPTQALWYPALWYYDYGEAFRKKEDWEQAAACYRESIKLNPARPEAHAALGIIMCRAKRSDEAVRLLTKAVELGTEDAEVYWRLANALNETGRHVEAEDAARKALHIAPDSAEAWEVLGETHGNCLRVDEAIECFWNAVARKPDWAVPHYAIGITLHGIGKLQEASEAMREALRRRPDFYNALVRLAMILDAAGHGDEAISLWKSAMELRPTHMAPRVGIALAYEKSGRIEEAIALLREVQKLRPDLQDGTYMLAALTGEDAPAAPPPDLVKHVYAAWYYDQHMQELEYGVPVALREAVGRVTTRRDLDVLDLGCGTGLCGQELRPMARKLVGVDLSEKMIQKARQRGVYDRLEIGEMVAWLRSENEQYDLLTAGAVLIHIGDLEDLFKTALAALRPSGLLAFSIEVHDGPRWALGRRRRYLHNPEYVRRMARQCAFEVIHESKLTPWKEHGKDLPGMVLVLKRNNAEV